MCNQFREFSSLKLNLEKSEACWIGKAKCREDKPIDCNWIHLCNDKIRILGVYNSYDTDLENSHNFFKWLVKWRIVLNAGNVDVSQLQVEYKYLKTLAVFRILYISRNWELQGLNY